jgi:hypothetical protein
MVSPPAPLENAGIRSKHPASDVTGALPALTKSQHLLYVANDSFAGPNNPGSVAIYALRGHDAKLVGELTDGIDGPRNPCLSASGTLYVPNENNATISVYPFGATSPSEILTADTGTPTGCAVDADGNLWVADYVKAAVFEFLNGRNKLGSVISGITCADSVAFDPAGNMYVGFGILFCPGGIDVFRPGESTPFETITRGLHGGRAIVSDIATGPDGTLYATDYAESGVLVYPPGKKRPSEKLTKRTYGAWALTVNALGDLYAANNSRVNHHNDYRVVEFPAKASSPRRIISNRERRADGVRYINGLAAWPSAPAR